MIPHTPPPALTRLVLVTVSLFVLACDQAPKAPEHERGLLSEHAARFVPDDTSLDTILPSFALDGPRQATGPVPDGWGPTPTFTHDAETYVARVAIEPGTDLYGTGEIAGPLLRNGARTQAWTEMPNPQSGMGGLRYDDTYDHLYQAHPWVLAVRADGSAFGVLADTTRRTRIDLTDGIRFEAPAPFPVVVIKGASPQEVLRELADLTGHLDMPPRWALGHQQNRFSYPDAATMRAIANDLRDHEIPTDVLWFDGAYMDGYKLFTFDDVAFPDAPAFIAELHDMGYRLVPIFDPGVRFDESYPLYQEAVEQDLLLKDADGAVYHGVVWGGREFAFPDYSHRATREWWSRHMGDFLGTSGFDGIWDDLNEPVHYGVVRWTLPESLPTRGDERYRAGTFTEYNNVYALQQLEASEVAFREAYPQRRPFILTRSNYIGGQRHAATWTGDNTGSWDHLLWSIAMIGNLGMSGQPFSGADIGGFMMEVGREEHDPELFAHWMLDEQVAGPPLREADHRRHVGEAHRLIEVRREPRDQLRDPRVHALGPNATTREPRDHVAAPRAQVFIGVARVLERREQARGELAEALARHMHDGRAREQAPRHLAAGLTVGGDEEVGHEAVPRERVRRVRRDREGRAGDAPRIPFEVGGASQRERQLDHVVSVHIRGRILLTRRRAEDPEARSLPDQDPTMRLRSHGAEPTPRVSGLPSASAPRRAAFTATLARPGGHAPR